MRYLLAMGLVPLLGGGGLEPVAAGDQADWMVLFNGVDLKGWKRVPIAPDDKLVAKNAWKVDAKNKLLVCVGVGVKEMLLHEKQVGDGVLHIEWRFKKTKDQFGYNSGVYVRTSIDGKVWLQTQVAHLEKPPLVANLFGDMLVHGRIKRVQTAGTGHRKVNPVGEWNSYDITCKGKSISVALNGVIVTKWDDCEVPVGHVGMQAEFYDIEFKNIKWKRL